MTTPSARPGSRDLDRARRPLLRRPSPGVTLWRPEIVLASAVVAMPAPTVTLAGPSFRPEAIRRQVESTRTVLESAAVARQALEARAAAGRVRGEQATTTRGRVAAAIATYRAEAQLDEVLIGAMREVKILMEERGLR
jgi:hypothetical protein